MSLPKKAKITVAVALLSVLVGGTYYLNRHESSAPTQTTDDAYVEADFTTVAPQVSGKVSRVLIEDNQVVKAGDLLIMIDDRDFVVAVEAAKAQVASAEANVASLQAHLVLQDSTIHQAQATVAADETNLKLAQENQKRYRNLASDGSGTVQALQQAEAQLGTQQASLEKNRAGLLAARQQVDILKAELEKAKAALAQAKAGQEAAALKLSYTRITAPVDGTIGQRTVRVGGFVSAGKPLLALVPLEAVYITANFRETQLANVRPGQTVEVKVDALPGEPLQGKVDSLSPASGVSYSPVAPHNATGNFTKIVQRLPVRISINPDQPAASNLRVGMSVTPMIRIQE